MAAHPNRVLKRLVDLCADARERYFAVMVANGLEPVMAASCFELTVLLAVSHSRTAPVWSCRSKPAF